MRNYLYRLLKNLLIINIVVLVSIDTIIAKPVAIVTFVDSATVNDTAIYLRDIAAVSIDSPTLKEQFASFIAGEIAPPGRTRFISTADFVLYRLQPSFKDVIVKVTENKRIVVRTAGVDWKVGDFAPVINDYLREHIDWKQGEWSVVIENSEDTWKTLDLPVKVSVEGSSSTAISRFPRGHLQLQLIVKQRERVIHIPLSCLIKITAPVVIAKSAISRGKVIDSSDIELRKVDLSCFGPDPYFKIEDLLGQRAIRNISQGSFLFNKLLTHIPAISKGDQVAISVAQGNVRISVIAIARENGCLGQKIWVENATTHKLVHGIIKNKNTVVVL